MPEPNRYATATAFRRALENRLRMISAEEKLPIERLRREVAFDRFLARLCADAKAPWVLKGGYALELRIKEARATKDIDMALRQAMGTGKTLNDAIHAALEKASALDLADFFVFEVGALMRDLDAAPYGGARFPVEARMDARTFVEFHIDIGAGDVIMTPLDTTEGRDWLKAEKIHAFTLPRPSANTRVRDLVDMVLLMASSPALDLPLVKKAIASTFERRKTHSMPDSLQAPPAEWGKPYAALARQCGLSEDLDTAFRQVDAFLKTA